MKPLLLIPARMSATRLPGKPLADIGGKPMVVRVWEQAVAADIGRVAVAAGEREIAEAVEAAGGEAVLTDPAHPSGSDRIKEAADRLDPDREHNVIVNIQGDLPSLAPETIRAAFAPLAMDRAHGAYDMATVAAPLAHAGEADDPSVVKAVVSLAPGAVTGPALYFTRATAPWGEGPLYHHLGIYGFRRRALETFVSLPPSPLETREKLEQLRAMEAGLRIAVTIVDAMPISVDTADDLARARKVIAPAPGGRS